MGERLEKALRSVGAVLLRQKKHRVYALPNGQKVTLASSPSDSRRGERNALADVYHAAGVEKPKRAKSTKPKAEKPGRREQEWKLPVNGMAHAMARSPLVTTKLQERIAELEEEVAVLAGREIDALAGWSEVSNELDRLKSLRVVRFALWITGKCK